MRSVQFNRVRDSGSSLHAPASLARPPCGLGPLPEERLPLWCAPAFADLFCLIAKAEPVLCAGTRSLDTNGLHQLCFATYGSWSRGTNRSGLCTNAECYLCEGRSAAIPGLSRRRRDRSPMVLTREVSSLTVSVLVAEGGCGRPFYYVYEIGHTRWVTVDSFIRRMIESTRYSMQAEQTRSRGFHR
jgi:hypothetical protein